jgi:trk system potassium uptake protein TrkA
MKFIIIGCGRMGVGLARLLISRGHTVTVVDKDSIAIERMGGSFQGQKIVGSGFDRRVLLQAGIERVDGLAAVMNNDDANLVAARLARHVFRVPKVAARLYDPRKVDVYNRLGVQVVATIPWTVNRFADLLSYSEMDTILSLGNGEVEIVEIEAPALLVGRKVGAVAIPGEVHVIAISRKGRTLLPTSETVFQKGDAVHIALLAASSERLKTMLSLS